jgi:folate-dependent phosphoribosylglycinamide formyltransferase PurN
MERARRSGVEARLIDTTVALDEQAMSILPVLEEFGIEVVVLAGYVKLVPAAVVDRYRGRMLNIHPALLPSFGGAGMYGIRVHRAVLTSGARVSGATVHLVDERYDEGGIVAQWPVPVLPTDTPEELAARVLKVEHQLLPLAVEMMVDRSSPRDGWDRRLHSRLAFELAATDAPSAASLRRFLINPESV